MRSACLCETCVQSIYIDMLSVKTDLYVYVETHMHAHLYAQVHVLVREHKLHEYVQAL
jgi:hypothetical protein